MNYDKFIWKLFLSPKGRLKTKEINKLNNYPNIKQYIENRYDDSGSIQESIRRIHFKEVWSLDEGKKFIDNLHYAYSKSTITTD